MTTFPMSYERHSCAVNLALCLSDLPADVSRIFSVLRQLLLVFNQTGVVTDLIEVRDHQFLALSTTGRI